MRRQFEIISYDEDGTKTIWLLEKNHACLMRQLPESRDYGLQSFKYDYFSHKKSINSTPFTTINFIYHVEYVLWWIVTLYWTSIGLLNINTHSPIFCENYLFKMLRRLSTHKVMEWSKWSSLNLNLFWPREKVKIYFLNLNHISKDKKVKKSLGLVGH